MTREQVIDRLRVWAARAQSEANEADVPTDTVSWLGQAQILSGAAEFLAGQGAQLDPSRVRLQLISGRQKSLGAWDLARTNERELSLHAGEVAGYDLALALLKDAGDSWPS